MISAPLYPNTIYKTHFAEPVQCRASFLELQECYFCARGETSKGMSSLSQENFLKGIGIGSKDKDDIPWLKSEDADMINKGWNKEIDKIGQPRIRIVHVPFTLGRVFLFQLHTMRFSFFFSSSLVLGEGTGTTVLVLVLCVVYSPLVDYQLP